MKRSAFVLPCISIALLAQSSGTPEQREFFENNVRPVLARECSACHSATKMGGLSLMSREDLLKGGASGPAVVPGNTEKSPLIAKIRQTDVAKRMPLGAAPLKDSEIANIVRWVQDGAYWPEAPPATGTNDNQFFESNIRPLLAFQCFNCHTTAKLGGLRLDSREGMLKGGATGPAVVPGDPDKSLLISAVRHTNPALMMPKNGASLSPAQIADLTKWVKDGAVWPEAEKEKPFSMTEAQRNLWSIQSLRQPALPQPRDRAWPLNDIDRFIAAKLDTEGLKPAPMANRRALLRRATYDLTGLPPTIDEVKAFEADKSPKAWEKVIDRLQASPRYGEKWARHWMDVVRYAEDDYNIAGKDRTERYKFAYTYRDWLIKAFNEDMPYGTFVRSQVAGDLVDDKARDKAIPGLGMNGLGVWHMTNMAPEIERADDWADRVDVTTKAFLGLTVACARCHDHKYDAIPTKDFYRLAGVFASSPYKPYPLVEKPVVEAYDKKKKELDEKETALKELIRKATELESSLLFMQTESYMVAAWRVGADKKATVESVANEHKLDAELLARWIRFLKKPPVNYSYLKNWQAMVERGGTLEDAKRLAHEFYQLADGIDKEKAKVKQDNETQLAKIKDPNAKEVFDPLPNDNKRTIKDFLLELKGISQEKAQLWTDMFDFEVPDPTKIGEGADAFSYGQGLPPGLLKFTDYALEKRLPADWTAQIARMREDIEAFKKELGEHYPFAFGLGELEQPVDLRVFVRGNPNVFGEEAPRAFLAMLSDGAPKPFTQGSGRLELAEDILKQSIASRVIVNRVWAWLMGSGIVSTPNNFGLAGTPPSNPELLDYLALQFRSEGGSIKKLQKEIMMSRTYQLSTENIEANAAKDPDNRFYWKSNTRRLDAEGVWDYLLSASGKIDLAQIGGPSQELADGMTRRGVYGVSSRMFPNAFQLTFDFLTPTISIERRYTTTIPQQRLFFLNSPMVHNQAEALAERIGSTGSEEDRVTKAFEICFQRPPSAEESAASIQFMHSPELIRAQEKLKADASSAQTGAQSESKNTAESTGADNNAAAKVAAAASVPKDSPLKSLCWALLSSTEFLYID